jgi:hypothetical protein
VGCGHYDTHGDKDGGGIARQMGDYVFGFCFNPDVDEDNAFHFIDYCLAKLSSSFFMNLDEEGYVASRAEITAGFDPKEMGRYWAQHRELICAKVKHVKERSVFTSNYTATYSEDLDGVFSVLNELADEAIGVATDVESTSTVSV